MDRVKSFLQKVYSIIIKPEMKVLPGQLAFFLVLSIIPIIVLIGVICSAINLPVENFTNSINNLFPKGVGDLLIPFINGEGLNITIGISMILGFTLASNGPHSIIITSNTLYGINHSNYLARRIKALLLTILLLVLFIFTIIVLVFGNDILHFILNLEFVSSFSSLIYNIVIILKWPIGLSIIYVFVKLIYTIAPDTSIPSRYNTRGSIFTTVLWSIVTVAYSYYVTNFNNYNIFYGSLTNIIILMLWVYILSYILVFGMAINVHDYELATKNNNE